MYRVLITDDEPLIRKGLHFSIDWNGLGFEVIGEAGNATAAKKIISKSEVHVLITDINMPEESGLTLLDWVTANYPKILTVVISGYSNFEYAVGALKYHTQDYILKPIKKDNIISCMQKIKDILDQDRKEQDQTIKSQKAAKNYFLQKLLYNTYVSTEEYNETCSRLEIFASHRKYAVLVIKLRDDGKTEVSLDKLYSLYQNDELEKCEVFVIPEADLDEINRLLEISKNQDAGMKYSIGSRQTADNLFVSFQNALSRLSDEKELGTNLFFGIHKEHRFLKELIDNIEISAYTQVDNLVNLKFSTFTDVRTAKQWCIWMMDQLEEYFNNSRLVGKYEQAVKNYECTEENRTDIDAFQDIFHAYMKKVYMTFEESSSNSHRQLIEKVRRITNSEYPKKSFSLTVLANRMDISYGYLSTQIKQITGISFTDYLLSVRMQKAADLLIEDRLKQYEIAEKVGYGSSRYFAETFKKYYHVSPSEYKNAKIGQNK